MERRLITIITKPLVDWLRTQLFQMPRPPFLEYPDGSLWTDNLDLLRWSYETMIGRRKQRVDATFAQLIHFRLPGAYASVRFRPLAAFCEDWRDAPDYTLFYPGACDWMGDREFGLMTHPLGEAADRERDLAHVRVLVKMRRKLTQAVAEELAGVIRQWFGDTGSVGVFGESGLASVSPRMRYGGHFAGFELDARGSGQETLNSLYLAVLNWGMNQRRPLVLTDLAADPNEPVFTSDLSAALT